YWPTDPPGSGALTAAPNAVLKSAPTGRRLTVLPPLSGYKGRVQQCSDMRKYDDADVRHVNPRPPHGADVTTATDETQPLSPAVTGHELLQAQNIEFSYGQMQVLFDV